MKQEERKISYDPTQSILLTNFLFSLFRHESKYNTLLRVYTNCNDQHCTSAFHYLRREGRKRGRERGREGEREGGEREGEGERERERGGGRE